MSGYPDLEKRIREIGHDIYSAAGEEVPSLFDTRKWMGRVMEWTTRDEAFRLRLFRYIDVLPSLKSDALAVRLLREYLEDVTVPPVIRKSIDLSTKGTLASNIAAKIIRSGVESIASQFIAGEDPQGSLKSLDRLWKNGFTFSIDLLGEVVLSKKESDEYTRRYLGLLDSLGAAAREWKGDSLLERDDSGPIPRFDVSMKVSSLYSQIDPIDWEGSMERTKDNLRRIFKKARESGASVCVDMEQYYYKDLTIAIFKSMLEEPGDCPFAGIALQAYLKDSENDLRKLIEWAKAKGKRITVRLVKGAYWDYETVINRQKGWQVPVFENKEETDLSFERLTRLLLENSRFVHPAIATHNIRSISSAIAAAESLNLASDSFEFQMLYGMAEPLRKVLRRMGYRIRVYTPLGKLIPGMAYLVRRLLENTSNESFIRRLFVESRSFEELMRPPMRRPSSSSPMEQSADEEKAFRNEPAVDFSRGENREKMIAALKEVRGLFGHECPLLVGGEEIMREKKIVSINPADPHEVVGRVSSAGIKDAERSVGEARKAFSAWKDVTPAERAGYLFHAADEMRKERYSLAALEVYEVGKTWKDADSDVSEAIDYLEYYGREMVRLGVPRRLGAYPGEVNEYYYEPMGVGAVISPWNFPLAIPAGMISAGLVAGNCVIFKPSGLSPVLGWKLVEIFRRIGLPPGVLQFLQGPGNEVGDFLVSHPELDFIAFTGSKDVGLDIIRKASDTRPGQRNIKKVVAEMGGKNAVIVDETADLDEAVAGVLESSMGYQGQKCSACSRVIVVGDVFEKFAARLTEAADSIQICAPESPAAFMGPVIDENALNSIQGYIDMGKRDGRPLLVRRVGKAGYFLGPVLLADVAPGSLVIREEIFGPVLVLMRAKGIDEAITIANDSLYALTGGIFSRSPANLRTAKKRFNVGNLYINRKITGALVGRQPFGGFGMSGVNSKAGGPDYIRQFMKPKSTSENILRRGFESSVVLREAPRQNT